MFENSELKISDTVGGYIKSTATWTRFISILGFIGVGFMLLAGIIMTVAFTFLGSSFGKGNTPPVFLGIVYIVEAPLLLIPTIFLFRYSSALKKLLSGPVSAQGIEDAVRLQKSYWKFIGILCLVGIALAVLGILVAIFVPLAMHFRK